MAIVERAAEIQGGGGEFVVAAAREAANRIIEETGVIRFAVAGQRGFAEAVVGPPKPPDGLEKAFASRRPRSLASRPRALAFCPARA
jgi:uncharacterized protein (DUF1778 family)